MGLESILPYVGMVVVQFAQVGLMVAGKVAMANGMTTYTFICYSNALSFLILVPINFFIYRSSHPPLFRTFLCGFFLLGFLGFLIQMFGYAGIKYASASLSSAMLNLIPGFTFILAVIFRMEKFDRRSVTTLVKSLGTVLTITGAVITTLYEGPLIFTLHSGGNTLHHILTQSSAWLIGGLLLAIDCAFASIYIITQAFVLKKYPAELLLMLFFSCFVAILSGAVSLIIERDYSAWSLKSKMRFLPVIYSGFFGTVFQVTIGMWCIKKRGPLFTAMFHPIGVVIAIAIGVVFLGESFYLGSLVGSLVVVVGFYAVMWGKAKEWKSNVFKSSESSGERTPLLESNVKDRVVSA